MADVPCRDPTSCPESRHRSATPMGLRGAAPDIPARLLPMRLLLSAANGPRSCGHRSCWPCGAPNPMLRSAKSGKPRHAAVFAIVRPVRQHRPSFGHETRLPESVIAVEASKPLTSWLQPRRAGNSTVLDTATRQFARNHLYPANLPACTYLTRNPDQLFQIDQSQPRRKNLDTNSATLSGSFNGNVQTPASIGLSAATATTPGMSGWRVPQWVDGRTTSILGMSTSE